jgi:hypothetical protein
MRFCLKRHFPRLQLISHEDVAIDDPHSHHQLEHPKELPVIAAKSFQASSVLAGYVN